MTDVRGSPAGELEQRLTEKVVVWRQLVVMIREDAAACHEPIERRHLSTKAAQLEACALELTAALAAAGPAAPGICAHRFDSTVCVALVGHDGPHVTSNHWFPHGLVVGAAGRAAASTPLNQKGWEAAWTAWGKRQGATRDGDTLDEILAAYVVAELDDRREIGERARRGYDDPPAPVGAASGSEALRSGKLLDIVLPQAVIFRPGELVEVTLTRVGIGQPRSAIYSQIVGFVNVGPYGAALDAIRLIGRASERTSDTL